MRTLCRITCFGLVLLLQFLLTPIAKAQPTSDDVAAAARVLEQATYPAANRQHHAVIRGLRRTKDPDLRPLYIWLSGQNHPDLQTHGLLGLAETDPQRALDLARLAEITDLRQRVEIIGAAMDDELLNPIQMNTLLGWKDLNQGVRQAIAIRLLAQGGAVDASLFEPALTGDPEKDTPGELLERGIAGVALTQLGDARGVPTLRSINALPASPQSNAVRAQLLTLAARHELSALADWALALARDAAAEPRLRESALRTALILEASGAPAQWRTMYLEQAELAGRIRLVLIACSVSSHINPTLFSEIDSGGLQLIDNLISAGRAASATAPIDLRPMQSLIELGYAPGTHWLVVYARDDAGQQAPALLEQIIRGYDKGHPSSRDALTLAAIEAAATLGELDDPAGPETLGKLIRETNDPKLRQILYTGLIRCDASSLDTLLADLPEPTDTVSRDAYLVLRLRHGLDLSPNQWTRANELVALPGQIDPGIRAELAWYCVKRAGQGKAVLERITLQADR